MVSIPLAMVQCCVHRFLSEKFISPVNLYQDIHLFAPLHVANICCTMPVESGAVLVDSWEIYESLNRISIVILRYKVRIVAMKLYAENSRSIPNDRCHSECGSLQE